MNQTFEKIYCDKYTCATCYADVRIRHLKKYIAINILAQHAAQTCFCYYDCLSETQIRFTWFDTVSWISYSYLNVKKKLKKGKHDIYTSNVLSYRHIFTFAYRYLYTSSLHACTQRLSLSLSVSHTYTQTCTHKRPYTYTQASTHTHTYTKPNKQDHLVCVYHVFKKIKAHTHTHINTHTQNQTNKTI